MAPRARCRPGEMRSRETDAAQQERRAVVVLHSARLVRDSRGIPPSTTKAPIADITASHRQARQWSHEASHDSLTGLLNRRELERRLQAALENAAIDRSTARGCDDRPRRLSRRSTIALATPAGDELLRHVSATLKANCAHGDVVGRFGGDEFLVLLEHCSEQDAMRVTGSMIERLRPQQCLWAGQCLQARASVGIAVAPQRDQSWVSLVERADLACYDAKARGGDQWRMFHDDATVNVKVGRERRSRCIWKRRSRPSLHPARRAHRAAAQSAIAHRTTRCCCARRTRAPRTSRRKTLDLAQIASVQRFACAPRGSLVPASRAFRWIARHQREHPGVGRWFLNLTQPSFSDPELAQYIARRGARGCRRPRSTSALRSKSRRSRSSFVQINELVRKLAPLGFQFTLDGFGRGISSFAYLKSLEVTNVKIDHAADRPRRGRRRRRHAAALPAPDQQGARTSTIIQSVVHSAELLKRLTAASVDYAQGPAVATAESSRRDAPASLSRAAPLPPRYSLPLSARTRALRPFPDAAFFRGLRTQ